MFKEWLSLVLPGAYNTQMVLLSVTALGVASGIAGSLLVLRKRALVVDALSHATLPGLVAAYLLFVGILGYSRNLTLLLSGALISGLLAAQAIQGLLRFTRLREDLVIGIVLSTYFGLGIALLSIVQVLGRGSEGGLNHFIYGQAAAMSASDAWIMFYCAVGAAILASLFLKEFRLLCFDADFGKVGGMSPGILDSLLLTLAVFVVVIGLQAVGVLLMVAFLIIPAVAARFWTERFSTMLILAAAIGGASGFIGAILSASFSGFPAGAVIVLTSGVFFTISFLIAPRRGLLSAFIRRIRLQMRIAEDHLLREIYQSLKTDPASSRRYPASDLLTLQDLDWTSEFWLSQRLRRKGYGHKAGDSIFITDLGISRAKRLTEHHEMWEQYLSQHSDLDASHLHHSADLAEHALDDDLADKLKKALQDKDVEAGQ